MNNEEVNDLILSCDIHKKYINFKLGNTKNKISRFGNHISFPRIPQHNHYLEDKFNLQCSNKTNLSNKITTSIKKNFANESKFKISGKSGVNYLTK
jgi:hypothetical protein